MMPHSNSTLIELHIPDFDLAKEFYGKLGFEVVWERKPEEFKGYLVLKCQENILCFWGGNQKVFEHPYFHQFPSTTKRGYGVELVIMVSDLRGKYDKAKEFAEVVEELKQQPWGLDDFRIVDPFGYYLRFTTPHNILDPGNAVA